MICKICIVGLMSCGMAMGQAASAPVAGATQTAGEEKAPKKAITFDVVSVRPNKAGMWGGSGPTADGYDQNNVLIYYIAQAYGLASQRILGLPDWYRTDDEYEIRAKVADADIPEWSKSNQTQLQGALQALLADRFQLKAHYETRDAPVFALVVAKGGPKFKAAMPSDPYLNGVHDPSGKPSIGLGYKYEPGSDHGRFVAQGATMAALVQNLNELVSGGLGRLLVDKTGLTGKYDFSLPIYFAWEGGPPSDNIAPSIFTVMEESLGLKLEPTTTPVEFLVIDHIERPSAN
jgi:uncharacterized protein (TIGR03435 family)